MSPSNTQRMSHRHSGSLHQSADGDDNVLKIRAVKARTFFNGIISFTVAREFLVPLINIDTRVLDAFVTTPYCDQVGSGDQDNAEDEVDPLAT
jgi:hypothetical protein